MRDSTIHRLAHRWLKLLILLTLIVLTPFASYEVWRRYVEYQIRSEVDSQNQGDSLCGWSFADGVLLYFEGKITADEGLVIRKTDVGSWRSVVDAALSVRSRLLQSDKPWYEQPCKIVFGISRTHLALITNHTQGPGFLENVWLVYARYAPF